eukprot:4332829-Prymnesium_polylepis.1
MPAAGSACPMFAFTPPIGSASSRRVSTDAASELTSMGSPRTVPVPCASLSVSEAGFDPASVSAARNNPACACPLGAVRLAERPSCRTALPSSLSSTVDLAGASIGNRANAPIASPRAYPSARSSKVLERPRAEVMPAIAKL